MNTTSLDDFPYELQTMVFSYLNQNDLAYCTRVCQAWNYRYTPKLWKHVENQAAPYRSKQRQFGIERFLSSAAAGAFKKHGNLIQSLKLKLHQQELLEVLQHCPPTFPSLTTLEVSGDYSEHQDLLATLLDRCIAGLKEVVFCMRGEHGSRFGFGLSPFEALLKHADTLEVLRFTGDMSLHPERLNQMLCSAPNLKVLYSPGNRELRLGSWLEAHDIVPSDWVCTNLEVLVCPILGIPRPGLTDNMSFRTIDGKRVSGRALLEVEESPIRQFQIYAQLAQLTKLRELRLGFLFDTFSSDYRRTYTTTHRQYDCLAMTLHSGLGLLKDLKELKIVGLENMEVGIDGVAEKEWTAENWPNTVIRYTDCSLDQGNEDFLDATQYIYE